MRLFPLIAAFLFASSVGAQTVENPDEIRVFFPRLESEGNLGKNVSTVLSLQLAQTGRRKPWPENPENHDFGIATMAWSEEPLPSQSHAAAEAEAANRNLLAQIVVWGYTRRYAGEVIADVNVTLPHYAPPPPARCATQPAPRLPCDYRQINFESWEVGDELKLSVGPPRRRFGISAIRLRSEVVDRFRDIEGLPIRAELRGGPILGYTGTDIRFLEYNPSLPGAPTKLRSQGVTGYVTLPELSDGVSEFADMVGGILQVFRGDWEAANASFTRVIESAAARAPVRLDAFLYRGMAQFRMGGSGMESFDAAQALAPFDRRAVQYAIMGYLSLGTKESHAAGLNLLSEKRQLFSPDDPWAGRAIKLLNQGP